MSRSYPSLVVVVTVGGVIRHIHGPYQSRRSADEQHRRIARTLRGINEVVVGPDGQALAPLWHAYIWPLDRGPVSLTRYRAERGRVEDYVAALDSALEAEERAVRADEVRL